jgi:hypothetical protein
MPEIYIIQYICDYVQNIVYKTKKNGQQPILDPTSAHTHTELGNNVAVTIIIITIYFINADIMNRMY